MSDLTFSVADIVGLPGNRKELRFERPVEGVATALCTVATPVSFEGALESVVEGVLVTGRAEAGASCSCARCLEPAPSSLRLELCELYSAPGHVPAPEEDAYRITDREIDLEPMLRDALALALPLVPLCREDCKGLCPHCGQDLNQTSCECSVDEVDPRWAGLDDLRARLEEAR